MHYSNLLLSDEEHQVIAKDEPELRNQLLQALDKLHEQLISTSLETIDSKTVGKCTKLVKVYKSLKYFFSVSAFDFLEGFL